MAAPNIRDALAHLNDALDALTIPSINIMPDGREEPTSLLEATIAEDLLRIDGALGPAGNSMFAVLAEEVKRAVLGIEAARQALGAPASEVQEP